MRPVRAPLLHPPALIGPEAALRVVAVADFAPRGPGYDPRARLRRRAVALRGGSEAVVVTFAWVDGRVRVRVLASGECSADDIDGAFVAARGIAAVDDDPSEFLALAGGHPVVGPLLRGADTRLAITPTIFESLAVAVIEQLVTGYEARASVRRLWRIAGEGVSGTMLVAAPTATAVRRVPIWQMHAIGVGARRAVTLHGCAGRGVAIERLRGLSPDVVVEKLQTVPGVGPWTANAVARNALGWADAVPVGDFHAPFTLTAALGGPADLRRDEADVANAAMIDLLAPFRPHRARVALVLEGGIEPGRRWRRPRVDPHRRQPWRY